MGFDWSQRSWRSRRQRLEKLAAARTCRAWAATPRTLDFMLEAKALNRADTARLVFYIILAAVCTIHCRKEEAGRKERRLEQSSVLRCKGSG